ncbi:hypothetical protein Tco_0641849 [Tanacetum coccineum]
MLRLFQALVMKVNGWLISKLSILVMIDEQEIDFLDFHNEGEDNVTPLFDSSGDTSLNNNSKSVYENATGQPQANSGGPGRMTTTRFSNPFVWMAGEMVCAMICRGSDWGLFTAYPYGSYLNPYPTSGNSSPRQMVINCDFKRMIRDVRCLLVLCGRDVVAGRYARDVNKTRTRLRPDPQTRIDWGIPELTGDGDGDGESLNYETGDGAGRKIPESPWGSPIPIGDEDGDGKQFPNEDGDGDGDEAHKWGWER